MNESTTHQAATPTPSPHGSAYPPEPWLIPVLAIVVTGLTAVLFHWLELPDDIATSLALASGGLVPIFALRRKDHKQSREAKINEAVSGKFERPLIYVLIIATSWLAIAAMTLSSLVRVLVYPESVLPEIFLPSSIRENPALVYHYDQETWVPLFLGISMLMAVAVLVGIFTAHRVKRHAIWCALGAVVLSEAARLVVYWGRVDRYFIIALAAICLGVMLGVVLGRRTRALFLATRLFKGLSEADRSAVLEIMGGAQVAGRLPS